ncbi:MAG: hypothetical protein ACRD45_09680, partial [Bryobacteraceae bacterium]
MTPRSIRRAAERKARKLARKAEKQAVMQAATAAPEPQMPIPETEPDLELLAPAAEPPLPDEPTIPKTPSPAQLAANRANAQLSTGPRSPAGKAVSRLNAVKSGLTGRSVLLPTDDVAAYEHHVREFMKELNPVGIREQCLAQSIADNMWR